jgi:predicted enzyme related to lactoylglutathione lyase
MSKVLGIGGVFFKTADVAALKAWYLRVLGLEITDYFAPSDKEFMFNLIVEDMDAMLARCASEGVKPIKTQDESYGRFAHIMDLEGRKVELWEPKEMPAQS